MARSRFDNLDDDEQEEIIRNAGEEFADKGYERASLNEIVERAGISKGSIYYYFENKEDLFSTVVERAFEAWITRFTDFSLEELTAETFWDEFEVLVLEMAEYAADHTWYMRLLRTFYRLRDREEGGVRESELFERVKQWTGRIIEHGQELGVVRTDAPREFLVEMSMAIGEAGDRWLLAHLEEYDARDFKREAERQVDVFRRVLEPRDDEA